MLIASILMAVLVALGMVFAPQITHVVAWGFRTDPEKFDLTVRLARIMFPFLFFVSLAAISAGALNSLKRFFLPALAPAMLLGDRGGLGAETYRVMRSAGLAHLASVR